MTSSTLQQRPAYLGENEEFYAKFWHTRDHYSSRFPNHDEALRAGPILECLATLAERHGWQARPPRLLDAGCGRGWLTHLVSTYGHAEGCEPVTGAIELARGLFPNVTFHALTPAELCRTPGFEPFDVVVCSEVIEHVPRELQAAFLAELRECLTPNGYVILTTPRGEMQALAGHTSNQLLEHWLSEDDLERLLRQAGLTPSLRRRAYPLGASALQADTARRMARGSRAAVVFRHRVRPWLQPVPGLVRAEAELMSGRAGERPGRPSDASQQGEFEAARRWVEEFPPEAERNAIYDRLFAPASLSWQRDRVLDVGAGPISIFENVAPASADVVAYDTLAERYNTLTPNKKFPIVATIPDGQFTLISILNCLDHMDEPAGLLDHVAPRLASHGVVWIYCNVDQPFDPTLHPQDFRFWQLVLLIGRYFDIERCGLVREGPLFPYGWWAICRARRRTPLTQALASTRFTLWCAAQYGWFGAVRAVVKAVKLLGGRRLLPPELQF